MRALLAGLAPITGQRAAGHLHLYGATGPVRIPRGTYAMPVGGSTGVAPTGIGAAMLDPSREVKVAVTGVSGYFAVATTGTAVPFVSNLGGARHNFPPGTRFVFDPPVPGLTGVAWSPSGFAGGADASGFGALRDVVIYENLDGPAYSVDLARSGLKAFPGAVLVWQSFMPADGSTVPTTQRSSRAGAKSHVYKVGYTLHVLSSRPDSSAMRRREALRALEAAMRMLTDGHAFDHEPVSHPGGVQVQQAYRLPLRQDVAQQLLVYSVSISCQVGFTQAADRRSFADWLLSRIQSYLASDAAEGDLLLADVTVDMRPLDLEVGLEQVDVGGESATAGG